MPGLINKPDQRMLLRHRLVSSISQRPLLCIGMMFYWTWVNLVFQTPLVFRAIYLTDVFALPSQVIPLITSVLSYLCICFRFKKTHHEFQQRAYLWIICGMMALGSAILILWLTCTMGPIDEATIARNPNIPAAICMFPLGVGSVLIGFFSACLCIELQRIFGSLGSQHVIFQGSVALLGSILIISAITFLPTEVQQAVFVLSPLPIAYCLWKTQGGFSKKELFSRGENIELIIPYRLLGTAFLHGLSLGVLLGWYPIASIDNTALLVCNFLSYALAGILLLITAIMIKLDFNHLIYQIAFMLIAAGALLGTLFNNTLLLGISVQLLGFCYLHLLMWGVCAYFIKNFNLPATWVIGISTCLFMFGQLLGALTSSILAQLPDSHIWIGKMNVMIVFVMLGASLFMMSSRNLQTGWGLAKPDSDFEPEQDRSFLVHRLATDAGLTKREVAIFSHLAKGKNRKTISEELFISEETVKSHMQNIYKKMGVHSQQDLIRLLDAEQQAS